MLISVSFDIIVLLHGLTISANCVMLFKNKMKFHIENSKRDRGAGVEETHAKRQNQS